MNTDKLTAELLEKKKEIEDAKIEVAQLEGSVKTHTEQLKKEFNCSTVQEGEIKIEELEKEIEKIDKEIEEEYAKLDKKMKKVEDD